MKRPALVALAGAQFIMVLDQSVMNVSISQLVADFDTTVTTIQAVITLYCLVMAMLMLTGGKIGDIIGRRRAFVIGLVIYACGSAITAVSQSVAMLTFGWSILEGIGAALVLPAMAALIAGNFEGKERKAAYAVIGGVAGAGIAIGPILGGWATTELSWRVVFLGEVVIVLGILAMTHLVKDAPRSGPKPKLDIVGSVLSATGLGLVVLGVLQSTTWGLIVPKDSPITPFGLALTPFVIALGGVLLWAFVAWQRHREAAGTDPLVHLDLMKVPPLRAGLIGLFSQNLILMGVFFTIPLYLQLVLGLDALRDGRQDAAHLGGDVRRGGGRFAARDALLRAWHHEGRPDGDRARLRHAPRNHPAGPRGPRVRRVDGRARRWHGADRVAARAGGPVVRRCVGPRRGGRPAVHRTAARLLAGRCARRRDRAHRPDQQLRDQGRVGRRGSAPRSPTRSAWRSNPAWTSSSSTDIEAAVEAAGLDQATTDAIVDDYEAAQIRSLKAGLLVVGLLALASLAFTGELPLKIASGDGPKPMNPGGPEAAEPPPVPATPSMA